MSNQYGGKRGADGVGRTHGACRGNGSSSAAAGAGHTYNHGGGSGWGASAVSGRQTNNRAEMTAARNVLNDMASDGVRGHAEVQTSSKYVADSMNEYYSNWQQNGFRTSSGKPVANQDLLHDTKAASKQFESVEFKYVPKGSGGPAEQGARGLSDAASGWKSGGKYY